MEVWAYDYYKDYPAILRSDYSYQESDGYCQFDSKPHTSVQATSYDELTDKSSSQTRAAIAKQPIAVGIYATSDGFLNYHRGIFNPYYCDTENNHAVNLVGYGTEDGQDYFILRNSWGASWGDKGYMKIADIGDGSGVCGVLVDPTIVYVN